MRVIGITGGIGTGKSTVSSYLRKLGYDVIDADAMARELSDDRVVLSEIRDLLGADMIGSDGKLDRKRMAAAVFSDVQKKELLESIITSRVIERAAGLIEDFRSGRTEAARDGMVFLDAPTLFETGAEKLVDEVWLVTCGMEKRIARAVKRDGASRDAVEARIANQISDDEKAEKADVVIHNDGSIEELYDEIDSLLKNQFKKSEKCI